MPPKKRKVEDDDEPQQKRGKKKTDDENGASGDNDLSEESIPEIKLQGSMLHGELMFCGGTNWDFIGRSSLPKGVKNVGGRNLWGPHRMKSLAGVRVRTVVSGCTACHSVIISTDGKAYSWGRNERGQLGHGDTKRRDIPTVIDSLDGINIVDAACGKNHTLVLTENGKVYAFGDNKFGQLGQGIQSPYIPSPTRIQHKGPPVRRLACGGEFSMIVDIRGNLFSFGCPEYGQLGHNTDGKYFVSSNKLGYTCELRPRRVQIFIEKTRDGQVLPITDVEVDDVQCGINHTIISDRKKRVYSWGFGGYGRLGHNEPKDELVPRLIKNFEGLNKGASLICTGAAFSMAVTELGALYLWGQNKPTGEAAMYPKPVQDLSGWQVRSIGCGNRSIVVAADQSLVSWGPSPTYGELGYGDTKPRSSSQPQEVKCLEGVYIHKVACGYGHTLMIARNDSDEDKARLEKIPEYEP